MDRSADLVVRNSLLEQLAKVNEERISFLTDVLRTAERRIKSLEEEVRELRLSGTPRVGDGGFGLSVGRWDDG